MDTLTVLRDQQFSLEAERAVRQYCRDVREVTYIQHGADNLIILANHEFTFRFPRNEAASKRLYFETALLQKLAGKITAIPIPEVVQVNRLPLFVVAKYIEGTHLTIPEVQQLSEDEQAAIGQTIAGFIVQLNQAVSGLEVRRLRTEAGVDDLEEPWVPYFERLFLRTPLPNNKLQDIVSHYYALWQDYVRHERATYAIHDDLHPVNLLFSGPRLSAILDFGDTNVGSIEEELRWLYCMGDGVLRPAIAEYQRLSGESITYDHVKVWAIMHELSSYTDRLARQQTESFPFLRAQANLRAWVPDFPL